MKLEHQRKIAAYPCPHCEVESGQACVSRTGKPTTVHILRISAAKRAATPGPCPTGCGLDLVLWRRQIIHHGGTHTFECAPALPTPTSTET